MNKPVLVIMAAGMGSRYGGMKQIDPVGPLDQPIIEYSIYDAKKAGFETVVFIIKKEIDVAFRAAIGDRVSKFINVEYAYQELTDLPEGFSVPEGRVKPWGTSHAILAARNIIDGPFAVINADDYYGPESFKVIYDYLTNNEDGDKLNYCMVGYLLKNTVTDNGSVSRGVCEANEDGTLKNIVETLRIEKFGDEIKYTLDDGETWTNLHPDTPVSMNMWGFTKSFNTEALNSFADFLTKGIATNPLKCEYLIPVLIDDLVKAEKATVKMLSSTDKWYGITYKEDKISVVTAINDKIAEGVYPVNLWE